jgi:hypothetical protein
LKKNGWVVEEGIPIFKLENQLFAGI